MAAQHAAFVRASALLVLVYSTPAMAQGAAGESGFLRMAVNVPMSINLPTSTTDPGPPISTWRSFVALEEMRLQLAFTNESHTPLWMYRSEMRNAIQFRVDAEGTLPVSARWLDEMNVAGEPLPVLATEEVLLEPQQMVIWTVAVRPATGQSFGPGTYRVTMNVRNSRNAVRDVRGDVWSGRVPLDGPFRAVVRIEPPTTTAELGLRYILEAQEKAWRNEFTNALNAYTRAAEVNPDDFAGMLGMAHMFRRLNRYREAIALYEKAFDASKRADSAISVLLALTYVGAGDDEKATNTLRAGAYRNEIGARIQEFRARVALERLEPER